MHQLAENSNTVAIMSNCSYMPMFIYSATSWREVLVSTFSVPMKQSGLVMIAYTLYSIAVFFFFDHTVTSHFIFMLSFGYTDITLGPWS